jgi:hypothetical protein
VWLRRVTYFATLIATLALVFMPFWIGQAPDPPFLTDGRTWIGSLIGLLRLVIPSFLSGWVRIYEHNAFYFIALLSLIMIFMALSTRLEFSLRDRARVVWHDALTAQPFPNPRTRTTLSWLGRRRTSRTYQRGLQIMKWHVLPNIFGPLLLLVGLWAAFGIYTQLRLPSLERGGAFCPLPSGGSRIEVISRDFSARATCNPMMGSVERGVTYDVSFYVVDDWYDGLHVTSPEGLPTNAMKAGAGYVGAPLRRVINARYMQPVLEIRPLNERPSLLRNVYLYPIELRREGETATLYRGRFTAPRTGELYLFANDAALPFEGQWAGRYNVSYFYERAPELGDGLRGNQGTACVLIARSDAGSDNAVKVLSPICLRAAERARQLEAIRNQTSGRQPYLLQ